MRFFRSSITVAVLSYSSLFVAQQLPAQTPLQNMAGPKGGTIIYGTVDGANTSPAAMGSILSHLHQQYGDRPKVGRVFKVRSSDSDAVFFTLTRHSPSPMKIAGMLLVSNTPGHVEAALMSDDAARFGTSINPMLEKLFTVWKPGGKSLVSPASNGTSRTEAMDTSTPAAPLHSFRLQDGSAMMMLADGWRVSPQSGGGTILAQGPNGEAVALGFPYLAYNSNDPRTLQMRRFAASPAGRNTSYAKTLYAPYGGDLGRTFAELNAQAGRVGGPSVGPVQVEQAKSTRPSGYSHCAILSGSSPAISGRPAMQFEGTFCQSQPDSSGGFMNLANLAFVRPDLATKERSTLLAMLASFQVNNAVVNAQASALAKPTIDAIHEIGRQVTERIHESDKQMDERRSSFEQHNDAMDRASQGFSNYILDKSVILDNQNNTHGTAWNGTAEAIVQSDPKRFEYVDTPNYWRGIDY